MAQMDESRHIIIAGAGPVGCVGALIFARAGIPVTLIEAADELMMDLRASTFHPPTLDMLDELELTPKLIEMGLIADRYQYRDRASGLYAEFKLDVLTGLVKHPFRLQCEQFKLTQLVVERLKAYPHAQVLMGTRVEGYQQGADGISVEIDGKAGKQVLKGRYLIGSDGAHSTVRKLADIDLEGFTYPELFLVLSTSYPLERHFENLAQVSYISDVEEWCTVLRTPTNWRVLFPTVPGATDEELCEPESLQDRLKRLTKMDGPFDIQHVSLYRIHQRVAKAYRVKNLLLAGDSAHLNNPLGGMGMNGGVHDIINLADKMIQILDHGASEDLLDLYERQRRTVTIEYIQQQTIANKQAIEEASGEARIQRIRDLQAVAADKDKARSFLRRMNMIDAVERSYAIT